MPNSALEESVRQVRNGLGYARLSDYGLISLTGPDAGAFLHAQATNDVLGLPSGQGQASALLDRKASLQAYFSLHRLEETFWILAEKSQISSIISHLEQYHFSEKLIIDDRSDVFTLLTIQGPKSRKLLKAYLGESWLLPTEHGILFLGTRSSGTSPMLIRRSLTGEEGYCLCFPQEHAQDFTEDLLRLGDSLGITYMPEPVREILRIEAGIPRFGIDMDHGTLLPETGLEQHAVSYTKGCYLGQEVVARVKTYGSVQKALVGLVLHGKTLPSPNATCFIQGKAEGVIKSRTYSSSLKAPIAMAYLSREYRVPQKAIEFVAEDQTYTATVVLLPFYTAPSATERAKVLYEEGLKLFAENEEEQAIARLQDAIDLDPNLADAYESLGVILGRHNRYDEAIALMKRLAELDPECVMAHTNLSVFYLKQGLKEEAEQEKALATTLSFKQAMAASRQKQDEAEAHRQRREALESKIGMFEEVLAMDPEDTLATYGLGNIYTELKRYDEAILLLERAIQQDSKYTVAYLALGKALEGVNNPVQAQMIYETGIAVAAKRGDLMPLNEMQRRLDALKALSPETI